jgi:NO-binding membrane sensor protein with MHYT domain
MIDMLEASHSALLVAASFAVSLLAAFTGLSLTRGLSALSLPARKAMVSMAAVALGGGIWSMHFVAMLGLRLPVPHFYDPLITLMSALVAILMTGLALLLLHFRTRSPPVLVAAGTLMGTGVAAMHYLGMSGMELCRPVYSVLGVAVALLASVALGVAAIWIAYGDRTRRNILLGTLVFGVSVVAVHFLAMAGTGFVVDAAPGNTGPMVDNGALALVVTLAAFLICGGFLLTSATFFGPQPVAVAPGPAGPAPQPLDRGARAAGQVPFERHGRTAFIAPDRIAAIRAEGHYTILYAEGQKLFCPWSISKARTRLPDAQFTQVHRSYLVNPRFVTGFERRKDNGVIYFEGTEGLDKVPVSRARLAEIRTRLGL